MIVTLIAFARLGLALDTFLSVGLQLLLGTLLRLVLAGLGVFAVACLCARLAQRVPRLSLWRLSRGVLGVLLALVIFLTGLAQKYGGGTNGTNRAGAVRALVPRSQSMEMGDEVAEDVQPPALWFTGVRPLAASVELDVAWDPGRIFGIGTLDLYAKQMFTNTAWSAVAFSLPSPGATGTTWTVEGATQASLTLAQTRDAGRPELVTRRAYAFDGSPVYWQETDYDLLGRPTDAHDSRALTREWLYNRRSELASATYTPAVGTPTAYGYTYDTIGNRVTATENSTTLTYTANALNQYTNINRTIEQSEQSNNPSYDADGNLTNDGRFDYAYDDENRLVSAYPATPAANDLAVENGYDHLHRRIRKVVYKYVNNEWTEHATHTFVWDGMNIVLERIVYANNTTRTCEYYWGPDRSGTEQGAGGVEGLLAVSVDGTFYFPLYGDNSNIVGYVSETGTFAAQFVYDPYGNIVETCGNQANLFSFGFSTKYHDREIGLVAYQRRFYSPTLGRWLNRDPIEEDGGWNLYGLCRNDPMSKIDGYGLYELTLISNDTSEGDALAWYLLGSLGNIVRCDIGSAEQLFSVMEEENSKRGSKITKLNLSGHGLYFGSGIRFAGGSKFDITDSKSRMGNRLKYYLAENAVVWLWSCNAAKTYEKCTRLDAVAKELDIQIYAKTGTVLSGPDGDVFSRVSRLIETWITREDTGVWKTFTPHPKIGEKGYKPGKTAYQIFKEEI